MLGVLIKGLGADHVIWGTDSIWFGSPQWQIEALRRLEIPEDMQKRFGFTPLGPADGPVKTAIFGTNASRLHHLEASKTGLHDELEARKEAYVAEGGKRTNRTYLGSSDLIAAHSSRDSLRTSGTGA